MELAEIEDFGVRLETVVFARGEVIVSQDAPFSGWWVIREGSAMVEVTDEQGRTHIVRLAQPGDLLGACGLKGHAAYCYTATASVDGTVACHMSVPVWESMASWPPSLTQAVIGRLSTQLAESYEKMQVIATRSASARLARLILDLDRLGVASTDGLTRGQMAEMIGVTTETAVRALTKLKRQGAVRTRRSAVVVVDRRRLERAADDA